MIPDPTPSVMECDDHYPFGEMISCGGFLTSHKFTGKERDSESNLDNFEARYFSSQMGRMMSPDPGNVGADPSNPQSWNMYSYVMNNPLRLTDPTSMDPDNGCSSAYDYFTNPECGGIIDTRISNSTMPPLISQRWHFQTPPCSDNDGFVSGWNGHNAER